MAETHVLSSELTGENGTRLLVATAAMLELVTPDSTIVYKAGQGLSFLFKGVQLGRRLGREPSGSKALRTVPADQHTIEVDSVIVRNLDPFEAKDIGLDPGVWALATPRDEESTPGGIVYAAEPGAADLQVIASELPAMRPAEVA